MKRTLALILAIVMATVCFLGCAAPAAPAQDAAPAAEAPAAPEASGEAPAPAAAESKGTIMWLSNLSSGIQYDTTMSYAKAICDELGYGWTVVYGDGMNDAANNLSAVKNGMTPDVVAIIASQDGGLAAIMEEYPELYVAGYNTDLRSVYEGENAACLESDHFLGTICDGYYDGTLTGKRSFDIVIEKGYKKVSVVLFPEFAYPNLTAGTNEFMRLVEEYNATAADADKIEVVSEPLVLMFSPLEESYFLEEGHDDLDCVVCFCAGVLFVYPTMVTAIANGTCAADAHMITGGFDNAPDLVANIGDDKLISAIFFSPAEDVAYSIILIDNAVNGCQYPDFKPDHVDGLLYLIDSDEDIENVMTKSMAGTSDISLTQLSIEEIKNLCVRFNPDATYADLVAMFGSEQLSTDALKNR